VTGDGPTDRRTDGRTTWLVIVLLSVSPSVSPSIRLSAQLSLQPSLGLRYASTLVHDSIVTGIDIRPALAPAAAVVAATPLQQGWSAEATVDFSWSALERRERGATIELGTLSALTVQLGFRRRLPAGMSARASIGGLKYLPSTRSGIFRSGAGGIFALGGAGLSYTPPGARAGPWRIGVEARYDVHQFITPGLRAQGFTSSRIVHRVALAVFAAGGRP
jgi:hypothetical protein